MYRLLALDLDDTLLGPDGSIPEANRSAVKAIHRAGIPVVICSGRAPVSIRKVAEQIFPLDDEIYFVSFNGARIATASSDKVMYQAYLEPPEIRGVLSLSRTFDATTNGYHGDEFLVERDGPRARRYAEATNMRYRVVPDLAEALPEGSPKLLVLTSTEEIDRYQRVLDEAADGRWRTTRSKPTYIEVVKTGADKGTALLHLAESLRVPAGEICAVGDSLNDREMVVAAGMGVAVANAREELKAVSQYVTTKTATEGALEEVMTRFFPEVHRD